MDDASKTPQTPNNDAPESASPFANNPQPASPQQPAAGLAGASSQTPGQGETTVPSAPEVPAAAETPAVPAASVPEPAPAPEWRPVSADPDAASVPPAGRPVYTPADQAADAAPQQPGFDGAQTAPQPDFAQPAGYQQNQPYEPYAAPQQPGSVPPGSVPPGAVPPQGAYPPNMPPYGYQPPKQTSGKIIGALVCGILAILFCWTIVPSIILGIVAIVLAGKGVRESGRDGKATGAKVCGIVGIVFSVLTLVAVIALGAVVGMAIDQAERNGSIRIEATDSWDDDSVHHPEGDAGNSANSGNAAPDGSSALGTGEEAIRSAATAQMDLLVAKDPAMVQELARELDDEMRDSTEYLAGGNGISLTDAGVDPAALAQWILDGMTYTVDDVYAYSNGSEADAYLTIDMRDVSAFSTLYYDKLGDALAGTSGVTADQLKSIVSSCVNSAMAESQGRTPVTYYIEFENRGGTWTPDDGWYDDLVEYCFY